MVLQLKPMGTLKAISRWGEMIKFSHSLFALPFAMIATFLAARSAFRAGDAPVCYPTAGQILLIVLCMVSARSVAMTFNRIVDAGIDTRNPRTANRGIPAGKISLRQAATFFVLAVLCFVAGCAGFRLWYGNSIPVVLSIPVLAYLCMYSYTKRFTRWSHFVLGSAIAISPVAAWLAIYPALVGWAAGVLMVAVTFWIAGFDIIYACQDIACDRAEGLHSLPARLGPAGALWVARGAHILTVIMLTLLIRVAGLGWLYGMGVGIVAILLLVENVLVRANDFSHVNVAFFTINGMISVLLGVLAITDCLLGLGLPVDAPS